MSGEDQPACIFVIEFKSFHRVAGFISGSNTHLTHIIESGRFPVMMFNVNRRSHDGFTKACYKDETLFDMLKN